MFLMEDKSRAEATADTVGQAIGIAEKATGKQVVYQVAEVKEEVTGMAATIDGGGMREVDPEVKALRKRIAELEDLMAKRDARIAEQQLELDKVYVPECQADDDMLITAAREKYVLSDGDINIDEGAVISYGSDPGAYVAAWVWVRFDDVLAWPHDVDD